MKLQTLDQIKDKYYGKKGTPDRDELERELEILRIGIQIRNARERLNLTQAQLAEKIGKKREYISLLERGETDMQLSTFISISQALGLRFGLM